RGPRSAHAVDSRTHRRPTMRSRRLAPMTPLRRSVRLAALALVLVLALTLPVPAQAPKSGGVLTIHPLTAPPSLSPHEESAIEAPDPHTVVFRLKRPQPSLLLLLASGYSPIYPAHVPIADLKTTCVGTGPYKLKDYRPGEFVEYVRNPNYFVKGRPYLDGVK